MSRSLEALLATSKAQPVGEVVESATTSFLAQATRLDGAPALGSFVLVPGDTETTIGVVGMVETSGIDVGARPIMRGHDDVRDQRIYEENPDLPLVLRTTFRAVIVGFCENSQYRQHLPSHPPKLHYSAHVASPAEVRAFTDLGLGYLSTLLNAPEVPVDEVIAANVRLTGELRGVADGFARSAGRELAQLLRADYARFTSILRRMVVS
jgi:hypothetical protein